MQFFVLLKHKNSVSPEEASNKAKRIPELVANNMPLVPEEVHLYHYPEHNVTVFSALSTRRATGNIGYSDCRATHFTVFDGLVYGVKGLEIESFDDNAAQIFGEYLDKYSSEEFYSHAKGTFAIARMNRKGQITAFSDFTGHTPLYFYEDDKVIAISNRQSLIANCVSEQIKPEYDLQSLSWILGHSNIFGINMPFKGVKLVDPGMWLNISADGELQFQSFERQFYLPIAGKKRELGHEDYNSAVASLKENFSLIKQLPISGIRQSLTGGKDSRLNLAFSIASGLHEKTEFFTNGREDSPEIECAGYLLDHFGLPHTTNISKPSEYNHERTWKFFRNHIYRYDGTVCPWDGLTSPQTNFSLEISGFGGELYRTQAKRFNKIKLDKLSDAQKAFEDYHQPMDPLGVLHEDVKNAQKSWLHAWVEKQSETVEDLNDLPDIFYVKNRLTHWGGVLKTSVPGKSFLIPLADLDLCSICYTGPTSLRRTDQFHFELMYRVNSWLASAPFLKDTWGPAVFDKNKNLNLAKEPFVSKKEVKSQNLVSWQWSFLAEGKEMIKELLLSQDNKDFLSLVNRDALEQKLDYDTSSMQIIHAKQILSLLGLTVLLNDLQLPVKDKYFKGDELPRLYTNLPGVEVSSLSGVAG
jgi:hypothetical protein